MSHELVVKVSGGQAQVMCSDCLDCIELLDDGSLYTLPQLTAMETEHRVTAIRAEVDHQCKYEST